MKYLKIKMSGWVEDDNRFQLNEPNLTYSLTVDGPEYQSTGIIDVDGNMFCRSPEPMGFHNPKDY